MKQGSKHVGRTMSSHKMLADQGITDQGKQTQENSLSPCVKHFFSCEEGPGTDNMLDIIAGMSIGPPAYAGATVTDGFDTSLVRRLDGGSGTGGMNGTFYQPHEQDTLIVVCARSIDDTAFGDIGRNGFINFYMGNGGGMRVQPYYCTLDSVAGDAIGTPFTHEYGVRVPGQDYMFAGAKAGRNLIHWADGVETGRANVDDGRRSAGLLSWWDDFTPGATTRLTHSAYALDVGLCKNGIVDPYPIPDTDCAGQGFGPVGYIRPDGSGTEVLGIFWPKVDEDNRALVGESAQDFYGILICTFEDGLPDDVPEALVWMKEQWLMGNKVVWPGWSSLKG